MKNNIKLKMTDITFFIQNDEKYPVFHDDECKCVFVRENDNGQLLVAWRWLTRAIWTVFKHHIDSGGIVKQNEDVIAEFESSGTIVQINITRFGCITREGSQLLSMILEPEMQSLVNKLINMPDLDYKSVIKLFADLSFMTDLVVQSDSESNQKTESISSLN